MAKTIPVELNAKDTWFSAIYYFRTIPYLGKYYFCGNIL